MLHGGTGIPDEMIAKAISLGVCKININTECQLVFAEATRKYIEAGKDLQGKGFDPRKLLAPGAQAIIDKCQGEDRAVRLRRQRLKGQISLAVSHPTHLSLDETDQKQAH